MGKRHTATQHGAVQNRASAAPCATVRSGAGASRVQGGLQREEGPSPVEFPGHQWEQRRCRAVPAGYARDAEPIGVAVDASVVEDPPGVDGHHDDVEEDGQGEGNLRDEERLRVLPQRGPKVYVGQGTHTCT